MSVPLRSDRLHDQHRQRIGSLSFTPQNQDSRAGVTQLEVQEALGWGRSYISQLLTKQKALRLEQPLLVLRVINVEPDDFFRELYHLSSGEPYDKGMRRRSVDRFAVPKASTELCPTTREMEETYHAASKNMRDRFRQAYRAFVAKFQEASLKIKFGNVTAAIFPKGSFPPSLPFIRSGEEFDPLADAGGSPSFAALLTAEP